MVIATAFNFLRCGGISPIYPAGLIQGRQQLTSPTLSRLRDFLRISGTYAFHDAPYTVGAAAGSLKAVQNQIHTRDLWDLGISNFESAGTSMTTTNFTKINLVKACCDLVEVTSQSDSEKKTAFLLLSTLFCHQIWGTFYIRPTSKAVSKSKQQQRLLIRVKLGAAMGINSESRFRTAVPRWSRVCIWLFTASTYS